ncbi:MAG: GNAT family protein [Candidatus Bathyarchaeota archaeon]|jgi:ribosomal-protein-alanine N-acetyltransferase|nr:GNAT family N-acetyltransferase [Candidatus Bathyarchaeota archaeon A05DMB-5]MDH7558097.1 GNAT family protein [Candidatus Bathyarchaeota archaeon]
MLEGKRINLRLAEKEDVPLLAQWLSDVEFAGDYQHFPEQISKAQLEKRILEQKLYQTKWIDFIIEKKDGTKIEWATHYISAPNFGWIEIGYAIVPNERNKGYGTEAIQILVDYLFLTREIARIQAVINKEDVASRRVLEKAQFKKEGILRKALWDSKGKLADGYIYSILREEWKEPRILAKASQAKE